jgi:thiamine-monophosphate kinase
MKLSRLGEDRLLAELLPSLGKDGDVVRGAGDDCAVVRPPRGKNLLLLKCDCVVEGIHFEAATDAARVGWKAMMRPLSDFAAMSGLPRYALVSLIISPGRTLAWVKKLYRGLTRAASQFDVVIVGGETSSTRGATAISVTVAGSVERERCVSRAGGKAGDDLFVTGRLGGSRRGHHLRFRPRIEEARWLTANFSVHAMMDLSDGLGTDLPRLARASGLGFQVAREKLPCNPGASLTNAISDGEDFELIFAVSPRERAQLEERWRKKFPRLRLTRIGRLDRKSKIKNQKLGSGYIHFR